MQFPKEPLLLCMVFLAVEKTFIFWVLSDLLRRKMMKTARFPSWQNAEWDQILSLGQTCSTFIKRHLKWTIE